MVASVVVVVGSLVVVVASVVVVLGGFGFLVVDVLGGSGFVVVVVFGGRGFSVLVVASVVVVTHVELVVAQVVVIAQVVWGGAVVSGTEVVVVDIGVVEVVVVGAVVVLEGSGSVETGAVLVFGEAEAGVREPPDRRVDCTVTIVLGGVAAEVGPADSVVAGASDSMAVDGAGVDVLVVPRVSVEVEVDSIWATPSTDGLPPEPSRA